MEGEEEEEGKQKKINNISNTEKQEEKKKSSEEEEEEMDDECECSPLQSPLHTLDDDDDDHHKPPSSSPPPPLKKEKPFFHRPLPQLLHPKPQRLPPPPYLDPQPLQQQRQPPPPQYLDPQPQRQLPPPLNPQPQGQSPPTFDPQPGGHPQPTPLSNPQPQSQRRQPPQPLNPHQSTAISIMNPHQSTAVVAVNRFSPVRSPPLEKMNLPHTVPPPPPSETVTVKPPQSPVFVVNQPIPEELSKMDDGDHHRHKQGSNGDVEDGGGGNRKPRALPSVLSRQRKEDMVKKAALGFRLCAVVFCLVSFSVMAADKTQGWAGDSFDRYKEYRYCISVTIIGFVYAGFQAYDLAYNLITEKHIIPYYIRYYFDFSMDQILTYLLISASSSAATRVDDWQTNWGKDEFTEMASASVGMSFMAFVAFAFSSLISGYNLCMRNYHN